MTKPVQPKKAETPTGLPAWVKITILVVGGLVGVGVAFAILEMMAAANRAAENMPDNVG